MAVDDDRAERLLLVEHVIDRAAQMHELLAIEWRCAIRGREPRRREQRVALAQWHVERAREREHDLATRLRAPVLDEAQVLRGHARACGELLLAHAPRESPRA